MTIIIIFFYFFFIFIWNSISVAVARSHVVRSRTEKSPIWFFGHSNCFSCIVDGKVSPLRIINERPVVNSLNSSNQTNRNLSLTFSNSAELAPNNATSFFTFKSKFSAQQVVFKAWPGISTLNLNISQISSEILGQLHIL